MTHYWIQQQFSGIKWQPSRSSVKPCKQIGRAIPTHKFTQMPDFTCIMSHRPLVPVAYFTVERRKGGWAKSIKVTVSIIQSVLRWNQPNNTNSLPTAELAFPLFSLMKWLLKWKEILIGWFSLDAFWEENGPMQFPPPTLKTRVVVLVWCVFVSCVWTHMKCRVYCRHT